MKAEGKKLRDDKEKVMEVLFGLFEKHQYCNIRDLVKETSQLVAYLKKVLKAYAQLVKYDTTFKNDPEVFEHVFQCYQVWTACGKSN